MGNKASSTSGAQQSPPASTPQQQASSSPRQPPGLQSSIDDDSLIEQITMSSYPHQQKPTYASVARRMTNTTTATGGCDERSLHSLQVPKYPHYASANSIHSGIAPIDPNFVYIAHDAPRRHTMLGGAFGPPDPPKHNTRPRPQPSIDIESRAESIVHSHIADLDFVEEPLNDDDLDDVIQYAATLPHGESHAQDGEKFEIQRSILPARRRKYLNLRYLTRLRGVVKIAQTVWAVALLIGTHVNREDDHYLMQKITSKVCPFLIILNLMIMNGYTAFPHLTIKDAPTRNGMLFTELLICLLCAAYFLACAPLRAAELILVRFNLPSLLITVILQVPLTVLILYDLFGCFGEWSLVGMRPLGQRVTPPGDTLPKVSRNAVNAPGAYTNGSFADDGPFPAGKRQGNDFQ